MNAGTQQAVLGAVPSEQQLTAAAAAVQALLVQGKKQEALKVRALVARLLQC